MKITSDIEVARKHKKSGDYVYIHRNEKYYIISFEPIPREIFEIGLKTIDKDELNVFIEEDEIALEFEFEGWYLEDFKIRVRHNPNNIKLLDVVVENNTDYVGDSFSQKLKLRIYYRDFYELLSKGDSLPTIDLDLFNLPKELKEDEEVIHLTNQIVKEFIKALVFKHNFEMNFLDSKYGEPIFFDENRHEEPSRD